MIPARPVEQGIAKFHIHRLMYLFVGWVCHSQITETIPTCMYFVVHSLGQRIFSA